MILIPVQDTPSQHFTINLAGQQSHIELHTKSTGLYCTLSVTGNLIIGGVRCENGARIVINEYLGFNGDLVWYDTRGDSSPAYPGLGSRYRFYYLTAQELNNYYDF